MSWPSIAIAYFGYLAVVALVFRRFARARAWAIAGAAGSLALPTIAAATRDLAIVEALLPAPVLLCGYWLSGRFFNAPMPNLESMLIAIDHRVLDRTGILRWYRNAVPLVHDYFELAYLCVYVVVPAGAVTLLAGGQRDAIDMYWRVVLLAEFASYGMLPWLQTRPPRSIELHESGRPDGLVRRLSLKVLGAGSIGVNTIPSGHAAGSVAVALAVGSAMPRAGVVYLLLAVSITFATVLGRYHYVVDSVLGVLVAVIVWAAMT
jgi:membrane-associated phospholipid phosphatase